MNNAVVIVAAGRGERLGAGSGPKQYREINHKAILQHTLECFISHPEIDLVQIVIHADDQALYDKAVTPHAKVLPPVMGGPTRQSSCKAGVDALEGKNIAKVLIHDAARPFVSQTVISNTLGGIQSNTCSLPAIAVADTVKKQEQPGASPRTIPREGLYLAQTPQGFVWSEIAAAHARANAETKEEFTDDAAVAEWVGMDVVLVEGDRENFKITTPQDLAAAREKHTVFSGIMDIRTGHGYDVHTLGPGTEVILCGVAIPHSQALQGHSDADVGLHSLTDALLGTIGAGDIGSHFPPSDPQWKGAASDQFLAHAIDLVRNAGGIVTHLDVTIICEVPKIGPHRDTMRSRIADICGVDETRVAVKATTNEGIGFIGRGEGIAALATSTVCFGSIQNV